MASRSLAGLRPYWNSLRYGFLFLPGLISLGLGLLALALIELDRLGHENGLAGFGGDASAARSLLTTVATSLITVAGITFSITIVTLQLVSQQFSSRALRNFLGDRVTQAVAGAFVGTFLYCLLTLRVVRDADQTGTFDGFVPGLTVTVAIALAIVALGLLLTFIHRMAESIQVSTIASRIARATLAALESIYPNAGEPVHSDPELLLEEWGAAGKPGAVHATRPGYVNSIGLEELHSKGFDSCRIELPVALGDFVTEAQPIALVWPREAAHHLCNEIRRAVQVESERNVEQDALYGIRQLSDIAIRALSPSLSDPTTARTCIAYLQAILERMASRPLPVPVRRFPRTNAVVVAHRSSFADYLDAGLLQIAHYAAPDAHVTASLLEALARVATSACAAQETERVELLAEAAETVVEAAFEQARTSHERELIVRAHDAVLAAAGPAGGPTGGPR